jgi:hypothetical protein
MSHFSTKTFFTTRSFDEETQNSLKISKILSILMLAAEAGQTSSVAHLVGSRVCMTEEFRVQGRFL